MTEVYAIKIPEQLDQSIFNLLLTRVSPAKRRRILEYVRFEDRLRCIFADLLVRSLIMNTTNLKNSDISFRTNQYGKPFLEGKDDFHFNLSHSGIWVVAAVDTQPVGIDVEQISDVDLAISRNYFSEDEHQDLMSSDDRLSYFFTLWTMKESYIKILGKGLSKPLNSFSAKYITEDRFSITSDGKELDDVTFAQYDIHKEYKLTLCASGSNQELPKKVIMKNTHLLMERFIPY
ncbi:MAG: 4'-phosphopantetheinyl transferase superfamily protein [bacterium]|nr:4'-phosphopantetheinyl transferase superfamily protein [bacterium]